MAQEEQSKQINLSIYFSRSKAQEAKGKREDGLLGISPHTYADQRNLIDDESDHNARKHKPKHAPPGLKLGLKHISAKKKT